MKITLFISFVCCIALQGAAQLQLDQIMKGPGFVGALPESPEWSLDGKQIYYWSKHPDSLKPNYYGYQLQNAQTKELNAQEWQSRWVWTAGQGALNQVRVGFRQIKLILGLRIAR